MDSRRRWPEEGNPVRPVVNKDIVAEAFGDWSAGTGGVFDLLAPDATWTIVGNATVSGTYSGKEHFLRTVIDPLNARLATPLVPVVQALYAEGDTVIAHFTASATAADGRPYENEYTWYLTLDRGQVATVVAFFDSVAFNDLWTRVDPGSAGAT